MYILARFAIFKLSFVSFDFFLTSLIVRKLMYLILMSQKLRRVIFKREPFLKFYWVYIL